ncbi:MAG: hypothetical protein ACE5Z5_01010 [Candidatus Bathyarchaeia archaeon]
MIDVEVKTFIIVRVPERIARRWVAKHEKDGISEGKLSTFIRVEYSLQLYDRANEDLFLFTMRFQKRSGQPMRASLFVRERKHNNVVELILIRGHIQPI